MVNTHVIGGIPTLNSIVRRPFRRRLKDLCVCVCVCVLSSVTTFLFTLRPSTIIQVFLQCNLVNLHPDCART
jgi:hypothetical protein